MAAPYHELSLSWDFDAIFKYNYFNEKIIATGSEILLNYFDTCKFFYEIEVLNDSVLTLAESNSRCLFTSSLIKNPFLFIRNIGTGNLYINSSSESNSGNYFSYFDQKVTGVNFKSCFNYKLNPSEAIFFNVNATEDGICYYSNSCYELGFNYCFSNLEDLNLSTDYPNISYSYLDINGLKGQVYNYENFQISDAFANKGNCQIYASFNKEVKTNGLISGYHYLCFDGASRINLICDPNSGNYDFFNFSGCFNFEVVATPEDAAQERIFMGKGGGSNGWGSNGQAWYTVFNVNGFSIGMSLGGGNFQTIGFSLTGSGLTPCLNTGCFYHLMVASDSCCFSIYINGVKQGYADCSVCNIVPYLYPSNTNNCTFIIGANTTNSPEKFYVGCVKNVKYSTGVFPYSLDINENFTPCEDILNCNENALLLLNFPNKTINTNNFKTYCFLNSVDNCANLNINFSGSGFLNSGFDIVSIYGNNLNCANFKINCVSIFENSNLLSDDIYNTGYGSIITNNTNYLLIYYPSLFFSGVDSYYYIHSGDNESSCEKIYCDNLIYEISGSSEILKNTLLNFNNAKNKNLYLCLNLCSGHSIKDLKNFDVSRCNLFLPDIDVFNYAYCYKLANANVSYETGISGFWVDCINCLNFNKFINYLNTVCITGIDYDLNKSCIYNIDVNFSNQKFCTSSIICKEKESVGESFLANFSKDEDLFFYSGLEFRYFPVQSIFYNNCQYEIPNCCIQIELEVTGKKINIDYPVRALNLEKLKIISDSEIYDKINCAAANLNYSNLNLNLNLTGNNNFSIQVPKIKKEDLSGYEAPDFSLDVSLLNTIENSSKLYLDPYSNLNMDRFYGLNNFLFLIASYLNGGIASLGCDFSTYQYQNVDYNFLMIDLENEFYDNCYSVPSGTGYFLIEEKKICSDYILNNPFSYKSISGNGYNYIMPLRNCLYFSDCFFDNSCSGFFVEKNISGNLNFIQTGASYCAGNTGVIDYFDEFGNLTGSYTGFLEDSNFILNNTFFNIKINSESILESYSGRFLSICNYYSFTGVQPIRISTNYPLFEIKLPIVCTNMNCYNSTNSEEKLDNYFYIVYDFSKKCNSTIKMISPHLTQIEYVCWFDIQNKCVNYLDIGNCSAKIQLNTTNVKYCSDLFHENQINFNFENLNNICVNILGGLL